MDLKEYLDKVLCEDKPIGDKNKEIWLDYLKEKYSKDNEDLFVSFVSVDKIGINPNSSYKTPNGVYTYPMNFLVKGNKVPFRGRSAPKKIKILKAKSEKVLDHNLSKEEYEELRIKLIEKSEEKLKKGDKDKELNRIQSIKNHIRTLESYAISKTPFGKLWSVTRSLAKTPNEWSKILIDLGFDWVNDKGAGIIHENEPTQAVFLSPKAYDVVDEEYISTEERYKDLHKNVISDMKDIEVLLKDKPKEDVYNILMSKYSEIKKANLIDSISFVRLLLKLIYSETVKLPIEQRKEILSLYKNSIIKKIKGLGSGSLLLLDTLNAEGIHSVILYFKDFFTDIFYKMFKEGDGNDIFGYVDYAFLKFYFPNLFEKLIKDGYVKELQEALNKKDFDNIQLLYKKEIAQSTKNLKESLSLLTEEEFDLTNANKEDLYKTFKQTYEKSTGTSWDFDKFVQRSKNWKFFGNIEGFVTVRVQKSGFWKITGCAGSTKGILKGLEELVSKNVPLWTAASGEIVDMLKKKEFIVFKGILYGFAIKTFVDNVDPVVFGDEIEKVESDGAIVFNLDGKTVKKYFACNKLYLKEAIKSNKVPEIVRKVLEQFL